jgi:hypothetical protein
MLLLWGMWWVADCMAECYFGRSSVISVIPPWRRMGLDSIHLCTWSCLGLLLAGLVQNDVRGEDVCWIFVIIGEWTSDARYCSNMCVGSSGCFCPLVVYGLSNIERWTLLQNYPFFVVRKSVPIWRQVSFQCISRCTNALQGYVICTLPLLFVLAQNLFP